MSVSAATLLLPAPDATWRVWKPRAASPGDAIETPAAFTDTAKPLIVGLPASACRSIGLVLPMSEPEVMQQMVAAQLEKRGIRVGGEDDLNFRWHHLGNSGPHALVSVDVLADPFPVHLAAPQASDYTSALRLAQIPANHVVIVEEQGDLVLVVGHQGKLYHSHVFGQQPASASDLAQEITLTRLGLEANAGFSPIAGVTLVGAWDRSVREELQSALDMPVETTAQLAPSRTLDTRGWTTLLPPSVRESQRAAARRKKFARYGIIVAALYASLAFLGFAYLRYQKQVADSLAEEVESTAPAAAAVKETAERWKALSPALEPKRYPIVLLTQITSLMPPSGIVLREFEAKVDQIDIRGEARDAQLAFQFIEDLKKHRDLGRYNWSMPQPSVREKTAAFQATGKLQQ